MTEPLRVTLAEQIAEVKRELTMRRRVYPRMVGNGDLGVSEATRRMNRLEAVLRTLEEIAADVEAVVETVDLFSRPFPLTVRDDRRPALEPEYDPEAAFDVRVAEMRALVAESRAQLEAGIAEGRVAGSAAERLLAALEAMENETWPRGDG